MSQTFSYRDLETSESACLHMLTRRVNESLKVGDKVTVTVLEVKGGQVRLGIKAPRKVAVYREEIFERVQKEKARQLK
jgi:carbon storage regulator